MERVSELENDRYSGINEIFEQRKRIYKLSVPFSASKERALKTLRRSDASFDDWMRVYDDPESDPNLKKVSLIEMSKRAVTPSEWKCVYIRSTPGPKRSKAGSNLLEVATLEELIAIRDSDDPDYSLLFKRAAKRRTMKLKALNNIKILEEAR